MLIQCRTRVWRELEPGTPYLQPQAYRYIQIRTQAHTHNPSGQRKCLNDVVKFSRRLSGVSLDFCVLCRCTYASCKIQYDTHKDKLDNSCKIYFSSEMGASVVLRECAKITCVYVCVCGVACKYICVVIRLRESERGRNNYQYTHAHRDNSCPARDTAVVHA